MAHDRVPSFRAISRVFFSVVALAVLLYTAYLIRSTIGLILIATFLAIAMGPAVDFFDVRCRLPRAPSILATYVALLLVVFFIGLLVVPPVVTQVDRLAENAPGYIAELRGSETFRSYDDKYDITAKLEAQASSIPQRLGDAVGALRSVTVGVFSTVLQLVTVLTLAFFLLMDGGRMFRFCLAQVRPDRRGRTEDVARKIYAAVGGYVAGALIISAVAGTFTYITLLILGTPFAVPLAVLMAFFDLIPMVGATLGGVVILAVTAVTGFPGDAIAWLIVFILYQQFENNVVQPQVYGRTVNLHPLAVILGILIGSSLLGVLGALVAIPVTAAAQIVAKDWWQHRKLRAHAIALPADPPPATPPPAPASA